MGEINKFMRWTLPGLVTLTQLFLLFLLSDEDATLGFVKGLSESNGFAAALAAFVGSGAIGFIFAQVYFLVVDWGRWQLPDYSPPFHRKGKGGRLLIDGQDKGPFPDKSKAWLLHILFWHRLREQAIDIKGIQSITFRLADTMHSLGATFAGTFMTAVLWCYFQVRWSIISRECPSLEVWFSVAIWIGLLMLYRKGWRNVHRKLEVIMNSTMLSNLRSGSEAEDKSKLPIHLVYTEPPWNVVEEYSVHIPDEESKGDDQ